RDWLDFERSCLVAAFELRRGRLDLLLNRLARRRGRLSIAAPAEATGERLERFVAMRPWWPRKRKCLFETIAFCEFLAAAGLHADLVFGVMSRSFSAHCWLETNGVVLNDEAERVKPYTPICWSA